ncbi:MAG: S9 family peptidase [Bacteroidota bacterium]
MFKPFFCSLLLATWVGLLAAQPKVLQPELLWQLGRVSLEDVSPDGQQALYSVRYYNLATNSSQADLYTVNVEFGQTQKLTDGLRDWSQARFRPDQDKISFLRAGVLWQMDLDGSNPQRYADLPMEAYAWAPQGGHLLFVREVAYDSTLLQKHPDLPLARAQVTDDLMYRHWKQWEDGRYRNIFYVAYDSSGITGSAVNILRQAFDTPLQPFGGMEQITWSPDGQKIVYSCKKLRGQAYAISTNVDLYEYDLSSAQTRNLTAGMPGYDLEPAFSPDGRYLVWNSMARAGFEADRNRIFLLDLATGEKRELTEGQDRSCNHPRWHLNGGGLFYSAVQQATQQLYTYDLESQVHRRLTTGLHNYYDFVVTKRWLVARRASQSKPHEIFRVNQRSGKARALTTVNDRALSQIELGRVQPRFVPTTDGQKMLTWVIYPPDFDPSRRYPMILYCQGGPQSALSQFWSYRWNLQLMAAQGYLVVAPNRRGLPGFGREWNDAISRDWGGQAMQDLLSATDFFRAEPYVDSTRVAAVGASFGGYSVYWLAGNHAGRFRTFIAHAGLFNLESWYGTTEELFFANWDLGGPYWESELAADYARFSPHRYVQHWDRPLLVTHGALDFRVPVGEGLQAYQAAQLRGLHSRLLYFPDEGHWIQKAQNALLWQREFFRWLRETMPAED